MIQREAEFGKASHTPVGAWAILASLDYFPDACDKAAALVEHQQTVEGLVRLYIAKERLTGQHVQIHAVRAALPTVTPIGMTALLPLGSARVELEIEHNALHPKVNGKDTAVRANRLAFLADFGADCHDIEDLENVAARPPNLGNLLVVFGHEEVDHLGHGSADTLIRHVDREVEHLARLIRKLHHWGYPEVHVVTDHGFILLDEDRLPPEVRCEKDWCYLRKERFALVPASADVPLATLPCQWNDQMRLAVPLGLAFFTAEKSFAHGGIALQELVIPHLVSRSQTPARRLGVEVVLPTFELLPTAVKVTLRLQPQASQLLLFAEPGRTFRLGRT
jgi:hypothetical protein